MKALLPLVALTLAACATTSPADFALEQFQSDLPDLGLTRGPDGWYLTRLNGNFGEQSGSRIMHLPYSGGDWSVVQFPGDSDQGDFSFDPASNLAYYIAGGDIWSVRWSTEKRWVEGAAITALNTPGYEASPHPSPDGWLYFSSARPGGFGQGDIYRARKSDADWSIEPLGDAINSPTGEWNLTISPDGKLMVFEASGRPSNISASGDLYLSCSIDGEWKTAVPMNGLNTPDSDLEFRFVGPRSGVFTSAKIGGDGVLRYAGPEHFTICD